MTITRSYVVLSAVADAWLSTTDIADTLYAAGYSWSPATVRDTLKSLAERGLVLKRKVGAAYRWRTLDKPQPPAPAATIDTLPEGSIVVTPDEPPAALADVAARVAMLSARSSAYETLRTFISVLDGWVEGAKENNRSMDYRDDDRPQGITEFHVNDVRRIANETARMLGVRPPCPETS